MNYFIQDDDQPKGPLTAEQIRLRIRERGLSAFDLVRRESEGAWKALASLEEFEDEVAAVRPGAQPYDARPQGNPLAIVSLLVVLVPFSRQFENLCSRSWWQICRSQFNKRSHIQR